MGAVALELVVLVLGESEGGLNRSDVGHPSAGDEVLRLAVLADDRRGGVFGLVLPISVLADLDAEPLGAEQSGNGGVVLEVGARRVAPRLASAAVVLT